jgi:hypothetical protein
MIISIIIHEIEEIYVNSTNDVIRIIFNIQNSLQKGKNSMGNQICS